MQKTKPTAAQFGSANTTHNRPRFGSYAWLNTKTGTQRGTKATLLMAALLGGFALSIAGYINYFM